MSRAPLKPLLLITAGVIAAHVVLLQPVPLAIHAPGAAHAPAFSTRTVDVAPPPAAAPVVAPATNAAAPPQRPRAVIKPSPQPPVVHTAAIEAPPAPASVAPSPPAASAAAPSADSMGSPARALAIPGSVRLQYRVDVHKGLLSMQASSELRWHRDADRYEARLEVSAPLLPKRTQHSTGRITAEGLAPQRFSEKGRSEEAAHFEREKGKVSFSSNRPDAPLLPGAQDRLSVLLQLASLIGGDPAHYPPGTTVTIETAGTRDSEPWLFTVEGREQLQLPGGKVAGLKLIRHPRKEYDLKVELWLAPGMDYVPVRLRLTQPNGDSLDQQWSATDRG